MGDQATSEPAASTTPPAPPNEIHLLLSGGGYRATIYHLGVLRYLYEHKLPGDKKSLLCRVKKVVGVSGGAITAAHFAINAPLYESSFDDIAKKLIDFTATTSIRNDYVYKKKPVEEQLSSFFENKLLGELPKTVDLLIAGTDMRAGGPVLFSRSGVTIYSSAIEADGNAKLDKEFPKAAVSIGAAVAASAALPPIFPPVHIEIRKPEVGGGDLAHHPIADGGLRDNLGYEAYELANKEEHPSSWCLVSDGGQQLSNSTKNFRELRVTGFVSRLLRIFDIQMGRLQSITFPPNRPESSSRTQLASYLHVPMRAYSADGMAPDAGDDRMPENKLILHLRTLPGNVCISIEQIPTDLVTLGPSQRYGLLRLGYQNTKFILAEKQLHLERRTEDAAEFWEIAWPRGVDSFNRNNGQPIDCDAPIDKFEADYGDSSLMTQLRRERTPNFANKDIPPFVKNVLGVSVYGIISNLPWKIAGMLFAAPMLIVAGIG